MSNVDLLMREAKACIDKWEFHGRKSKDFGIAGGIKLCKAREQVRAGQWNKLLDKHGIARSTAGRLMLEHRQPEKVVERKEKDAAKYRKLQEAKAAVDLGRLGTETNTASKPLETKKVDILDSLPEEAVLIAAIEKLLRKADVDTLRRCLALLEE